MSCLVADAKIIRHELGIKPRRVGKRDRQANKVETDVRPVREKALFISAWKRPKFRGCADKTERAGPFEVIRARHGSPTKTSAEHAQPQ